MNNKRRKLKPGVEKHLRRIRAFAIAMQVSHFIMVAAMVAICAYYDNFQWHDLANQGVGLLIFLFWSWVHELASDLLEYA
jgi:hypothetical protein